MKSATQDLVSIPKHWDFSEQTVAKNFDTHVRQQLPWYDLATSMVADLVAAYLPHEGSVVDVGASTGNIGRAIADLLVAREAKLAALEPVLAMSDRYEGPGEVFSVKVEDFDFVPCDVIVCFLSLMFVPIMARKTVLENMRNALRTGGALIIVDRIENGGGYYGATMDRVRLAAKHRAGASTDDIVAKELSLIGCQRPLVCGDFWGEGKEFFRFGDFVGVLVEG